jgi:uncharacterized protein (TIGR03083 family)
MADRDHIAAYNNVRTRLSDLTLGLDNADLGTLVPASPDWTVKDVVAHVTGITTDVLAGNLEGVGSDAWTRSHVESRRDTALEDVLAEWAGNAPALDDGMRAAGPGMSELLIGDLVAHDFDARGALRNTDGRDSDATHIAFERYARGLGDRITQAGLPALQFDAGNNTVTAGEGTPGATVRGSAFELLRALTGRRSTDQIRALDWDGDAEPYLAIFATYPMRDDPLDE